MPTKPLDARSFDAFALSFGARKSEPREKAELSFAEDNAVPASLLVNPTDFVSLPLLEDTIPWNGDLAPEKLERFDTIAGDHQAVRSSLREGGRSLRAAFDHILFLT